jgi:hypothetical protein
VSDHLVRAARAGLGWPLPDGMDDAQLEARLLARAEPPPSASRPLPDWPTVHPELRRKGVTLQLLHMEYKERQPDGYQYIQFCRRHRAWQRHVCSAGLEAVHHAQMDETLEPALRRPQLAVDEERGQLGSGDIADQEPLEQEAVTQRKRVPVPTSRSGGLWSLRQDESCARPVRGRPHP